MSSYLKCHPSWSSALAGPWRWAMPDFFEKQPYDGSNVWILAAPMPLILLQIHMLIRYDPKITWPFRASLIPIISLLALRSGFAYYVNVEGVGQLDGRAQQINITLGCAAISTTICSLGWGLALRRPKLRVSKSEASGSEKGPVKDTFGDQMPIHFPGTNMPLELDLLLNLRGVGWEHGVKDGAHALPVPTYTWHERWVWICKRLAPLPWYILLYDAIVVLIDDPRFNVHARFTHGASIWDYRKTPFGILGPYMISIAYTSSFACVQYMQHTTLACLSVALFKDMPSRWDPPAVRVPWLSTSVRDFWGKRWHQYLRITFMTAGYWPVRDVLRPFAGHRIANAAAIVGTFLVSGILHELGRVALSPVPGFGITKVTLFFAIQPVAFFGEQLWVLCTGRKVRGFWGWLWTLTWILYTSPLLLDTMTRDGMLSAENKTLALTRRPITFMLDWLDRNFGSR